MPPHPKFVRVIRKVLKAFYAHTPETRKLPGDSLVDSPCGSDPSLREIYPSPPHPPPRQSTISASVYSRDQDGNAANDPDLHFPIPPVPDLPRNTTSFSAPTFASSVESLTSLTGQNRLSRDTTMLNAPSIDAIIHNAIPPHPAIADNPPPFARYSAPQPRQGDAARRATLVHQNHLRLQKRCISMEEEREHLAAQLEVVTHELADVEEQLGWAKIEITARGDVLQELREENRDLEQKRDRLTRGFHRTADCLGSTADQLRQLQTEHAACVEKEGLFEMRIETLLSSRFKCRTELKRKIDEFQVQLYKLSTLRNKADDLQVDKTILKEQEARIQHYLKQIQNQEQRIEGLEAQQAEYSDDLRLSQTELFNVHQRLRFAERELRRRQVLLDILVLNNQDLGLDVYCLKEQLKGVIRVYPVQDAPWPPLSRVRSLPAMV